MFSCFMLYSVIFFTIPVVRKKIKAKLAFAISTGAPAILVNEIIDTPPIVAFKTIKAWSI